VSEQLTSSDDICIRFGAVGISCGYYHSFNCSGYIVAGFEEARLGIVN
jgi:hypothetical protein